jgi:hypothetical protein
VKSSTHCSSIWVDEQNFKWLVSLTFSVVDGALTCTGFEVVSDSDQHPLTSTVLRKIPLGRLIDEALRDPSAELLAMAGLPTMNYLETLAAHGLGLMRERTPKSLSTRSGRPVKYESDHYAVVASIYLKAHRHPTEAVAHYFGVPRSRAANWVRRAREIGLITPVGSSTKTLDELPE